jgi:hypothetical protein
MYKHRLGWVLGLLWLIVGGCGSFPGNTQSSPLTWRQIPIANKTVTLDTSAGGYAILADFDNDGDLDAASGFASSGAVAGHIQNGINSWTTSIVGEGLGPVYSLASADLDNSSQPDIVAATGGGTMWVLLAPKFAGPTFTAWDRSSLPNPVPIARWDDVKIGQFDDLPQLEIIGTSVTGRAIVLWRTESLVTSGADYQGFVIAATSGDGFERLAVADVDGDSDPDIIAAGPTSGLVWLENLDRANNTTPWPVHAISSRLGISRIAAIDLDRNGTIDIVATDTLTGEVIWFENRGAPRTDPWPVHTMADLSPHVPNALSTADLDNDTLVDILVGTIGPDPSVFWLRQFNEPRQPWQVQLVTQPGFDIGELPVGNIDRTGGTDFATTLAGSNNPVVWYQQQ